MAEALLMSVTPERVGQMLQDAGYRIEHQVDDTGVPHVRSATGGMNFSIRMGNRALAPAEGYLDFTYVTVIKIDGDFPLERVNDWNRNKRFARLHRVDDFIVFDMDSVIAGGASERNLRAGIELWDRLIHELIVWLRGESAAPSGAANAA